MKYATLFLICALSAYGATNQVKRRSFQGSHWDRNSAKAIRTIEATEVPADRTNVVLSIMSTNWPGLAKTATLRLRIFDGEKWSQRAFPIASPRLATSPKHSAALAKNASQTVKINVPLPATAKPKSIVGVLQLHRPFDPVIEIK